MTFCRPLAKKFHLNVGKLSNSSWRLTEEQKVQEKMTGIREKREREKGLGILLQGGYIKREIPGGNFTQV